MASAQRGGRGQGDGPFVGAVLRTGFRVCGCVCAWDMRVLCSEILIKFAKCTIAIDAALGALRG